MGLTLSEETSNRVSEVVLPPRLGRNEACHCGSGSKYKRCCWERDEALRRQLRGAVWPAWMDDSRNKLRQFEKYVCNVFDLPGLLASLVDTRRTPKIPTRSEEHTSELQSRLHLVCRLLLEKKKSIPATDSGVTMPAKTSQPPAAHPRRRISVVAHALRSPIPLPYNSPASANRRTRVEKACT